MAKIGIRGAQSGKASLRTARAALRMHIARETHTVFFGA
jgi:hypothetical protein